MSNAALKRKQEICEAISAKDVFRSFWQVAYKYRMLIAFIYASDIAAQILSIVIPLYYKKFFDLITASGSTSTVAPELIHIIVVVLALSAASWVCMRFVFFGTNRWESTVMAELKQQAFDYMIEHSYRFFANNFTGSLVQRVNRYSRALEAIGDTVVFNVIPLSIKIFGVLIVLYFVSPPIMLILLVILCIFLVFNYFFSQWKLKYNIERAAADSLTTGVLSDAITNHTTIQLFTGGEAERQHFKEVSNNQARITRFTWDLDAIVDGIQALFIIFAEFLLFWFAIQYWVAGKITVGTFVLIQIYLLGLGGQLWNFSRIIRNFYESTADAKEMVEILQLPHEITDARDAQSLSISGGSIEFKSVEFNFNQTRPVLKKINLQIPGGQKVALVGPSGAGKSTIVKLLLRMFDVTSGSISVDGQNIQHVTQESLRTNISLVPQDPILFHRSLMDNIRYGKRDASDEEVIAASRLAHCHEFITSLPDGYNTKVGERGIKLSGGERQRVAIARAILRNAPILILDEATSSLDSQSETLIQDALKNLMQGKTTIAIAHRLSTIRQMDRILVIDSGTIIEDGTHEELTNKKDTLYNALWTLQAGGFLRDSEEIIKTIKQKK